MADQNKSPLKRKPSRLPGESLDDEIRKVVDNLLSERLLLAGLISAIAINDWIRWYTETPVNPFITTPLAIAAIIWFASDFVRARRKLRRLKLGRDGERAVGQFLERARVLGYDVYHDIVCKDANIDHVIVGPGGVFTIETKTHSKPPKGSPTIQYDPRNGSLRKGNIDISGYLGQAKAQANEIKMLLDEYSVASVDVQPVIVFPGWYIESEGQAPNRVWVLEPKAFMKWLKNSTTQLQPSVVNGVRQVLNRHVLEPNRS